MWQAKYEKLLAGGYEVLGAFREGRNGDAMTKAKALKIDAVALLLRVADCADLVEARQQPAPHLREGVEALERMVDTMDNLIVTYEREIGIVKV